jgi:hypothetical protein
MAGLDPVFAQKYDDMFTEALQQNESKLRPFVREKQIEGADVINFDVVAPASVISDRDISAAITVDQDQPLSRVYATMHRKESPRFFNDLQKFMQPHDDLAGTFARSTASAINREIDNVVLAALNTSNTSAGSAANMSDSLINQVFRMTEDSDWDHANMCWVVSPKVMAVVRGLQKYADRNYNGDQDPLKTGQAVPYLGMNFVVSSLLNNTAGNTATGTQHNTFLFDKDSVGLGFASDVRSEIRERVDLRGWQCVADCIVGAVTIRTPGVLKIAINGLTA